MTIPPDPEGVLMPYDWRLDSWTGLPRKIDFEGGELVDHIVAIAAGNPGAAHALGHATGHLMRTGSIYPTERILLRWLHEMNIVGAALSIAFRHYAKQDVVLFIHAVQDNSPDLVEYLNNHPGRDPDAAPCRVRRMPKIHGEPNRDIYVHYRDTRMGAPDTIHATISMSLEHFEAGGVSEIDALLVAARDRLLHMLEKARQG